MNDPETSLEKRVLALETRVQALEALAPGLPEKSRRVNSLAKNVSESHLNFRLELLSLVEDHIEVLKLMHSLVGPTDKAKNKLVLTYIRRAESKLDQFQARFAQLEETRKRLENNPPQNPPESEPKSDEIPPLKPSKLNQLLRSASLWNM